MANNGKKNEEEKGKKQDKEKEKKGERIRLIAGKVRQEQEQFVVDIEALVIGKDNQARTKCPVSFYVENLTRVASITTDEKEGKAVYTHHEPLSRAEQKISIRAQVDNSATEATISVELPPANYNISDEGTYRGLIQTFRSNFHRALSNRWVFLKTHFLRPTLTLVIALSVLYFAGGGNLSTILGTILGVVAGWRIGGKLLGSKLITALGLGFVAALFLMTLHYFYPGALVGILAYGMFLAYVIGGVCYLIEVLSRDKKGKPILNIFPTVPIVFFVLMMVLNFLGIFGSVIPDRSATPTDKPGKIYVGKIKEKRIDLSKKENVVTKAIGKPLRAIEQSAKDFQDMFDWTACLLLLVVYVALTELADAHNRRKREGKPREKGSPLWEPAGKMFAITEGIDMSLRALKRLFGKGEKK